MSALAKYETQNKRASFTPCELTSQQTRLWTETRAAFLWNCPAFSHVLYTMMNPHGGEHIALFTKDINIAATDGVCLIINPDRYFKYSLSERMFIIAHEILHNIWDHCGQMHVFAKRKEIRYADGTVLPYNSDTMNRAADYVINDALIDADVGQYNTDWLHDRSLAVGADSVIDAYRRVYEDDQKNPPPPNDGQPCDDGKPGPTKNKKGQHGFDEHLQPGTGGGNNPDKAMSERSDIEWKQAVAAGAAAAKAQGKLPASLERLFGDILEPQVPWTDKIDTFFARRVGTGGSDWRRPDRRLITRDDQIYAPGRSGHGAGTIVVGVDTSGSIAADPTIIDRFFAELVGILEDLRPKRLIVLWCDAKVHRYDEIEDASDLYSLRAKPVPGWGGTAFEPVFDWVTANSIEPDALVYLTDGDGSFPNQTPNYPVLWGDISNNASKYPFGDVVECPIKSS